MRKLFLLILFAGLVPHSSMAVSPGHAGKVVRLSEPVAVSDQYESFGGLVPDAPPALSLATVLGSEEHIGQERVINTNIAKVCQKKGCFFIARDGDAVARVSFKDYSFFIPTDSAGKQVTLLGTVSRQALTREQLDHAAEDLGEKPGEMAPLEYNILASAIRVPR